MLDGFRSFQTARMSRRPMARFLAATVALVVTHLWLIAPVLQNGDGAVYAEQIENHELSIRTTHVGYMLLGIVANGILPFGTERNLNLMCLVFAAAGAVAAGAIAHRFGASKGGSVLSALFVMGLQPYLRGAVLAEVDGVAAALILIAVASWLHELRIVSGVAFGFAMLVTPLSALSVPIILVTHVGIKRGKSAIAGHARSLMVFGAAALGVYSPFVLNYWHDYWGGGRGLLHAPRQPWDVEAQILRTVHFFGANTLPWLWLSFLGGVLIARLRGVVAGTLVAVTIAAVVGERFLDVPVQLPQLCLLAVFATLSIDKLSSVVWKIAAFVSLWLVAALPNYISQRNEVVYKVQLARIYRAMALQTPKLMVIGLGDSWIDGLQFERLIYNRTKLGLGLDLRQFANSSRSIARDRHDYALWFMSAPIAGMMNPFALHWRREPRSVLGHSYEVWLPMNH